MSDTLSTDSSQTTEVRRGGRIFSLSFAPVGEAGYVNVYGSDITERKGAEEQLREYSDRLEEMVDERTRELQKTQEQLVRHKTLAMLGQLAGGVGHELRNPLGVISNAVYFLQLTLGDADEKTREYLDIISSEVRISTKIVSDLLDLARTHPAEREDSAVPALVDQVLEKQPPPEGVEVVTKMPADLPPVYVDAGQIGQVLTNLITNAYQAMPDGGGLTIAAIESRSDDATRGTQHTIRIQVSDTGAGIPAENMDKLFEPLFTTKARGIGLGLAVSRNLTTANGGSIEVESEADKGSTFTVLLPAGGAEG